MSEGHGKKTGLLRDQVGIQVTPLFQQGDIIVCDLQQLAGGSPHVKGGVLSLKKGKTYELKFSLAAGNPSPLQFEADGDDAIWWNTSGCPLTEMHNGSGLSNPVVSDRQTTLTVEFDAPADSGLVFYSLNFSGGGRCDPIIIHD